MLFRSGVQNIYFVFKGASGQLFDLDYWQFSKSTSSGGSTSGVELVDNNGFESGMTGWGSVNGATLGLGYVTVNSGSLSLKVQNRTMTPAGAVQDITGKLERGKSYDVKANVRYNLSENASATGETTFYLSIIYGDGTIQNMSSVTTPGDKWAELSGNYTVPSNADLSNVRFFIETAFKSSPNAQDLVAFFVDDVSIKAVSSGTPSTPDSSVGSNVTDGWYYLKNINAGKYLQVANSTGGNNVNVEIGTGVGSAAQKWYVTNDGNGYVTLKNGLGYMLDVQYGASDDGRNIQTYTGNGADAQKFKCNATAQSGVFGITTKVSGDAKSLDVYNWSSADGANVCQWTYYGSENQLWRFEPCSN